MITAMRILHIVELLLIFCLIGISTVEGFFLVKLAQKEPSTALIVVEDTKNLTELPPVPEVQITEK